MNKPRIVFADKIVLKRSEELTKHFTLGSDQSALIAAIAEHAIAGLNDLTGLWEIHAEHDDYAVALDLMCLEEYDANTRPGIWRDDGWSLISNDKMRWRIYRHGMPIVGDFAVYAVVAHPKSTWAFDISIFIARFE